MLKIKDEIDLKELEKFGFVEENNNYYRDYCGHTLMVITYPNRIIGSYFRSENDKDYSVLFDLIQAGLVEKIGE